jgi:hypothetical protein
MMLAPAWWTAASFFALLLTAVACGARTGADAQLQWERAVSVAADRQERAAAAEKDRRLLSRSKKAWAQKHGSRRADAVAGVQADEWLRWAANNPNATPHDLLKAARAAGATLESGSPRSDISRHMEEIASRNPRAYGGLETNRAYVENPSFARPWAMARCSRSPAGVRGRRLSSG